MLPEMLPELTLPTLLLLYGGQIDRYWLVHIVPSVSFTLVHQPSIRSKPFSLSDVNVMKTLVLAGCGLIDFGGKLKLSC